MSSWRDQILKEFTPKVARLTLVADPDGLLLEEGILEGIRERGFELIPFEDHIAFRYAYESQFRSRWDRGEQTDLVVVLRSETADLNALPYDLLQAGRKLSFNLYDIFPSLSCPVVADLDRSDFDALYDAQQKYSPGTIGDNATKEFILRHVFEIAPELIKQPSDLLRTILRLHYCEQRVPDALNERLIQLLKQNDTFESWPIETIIPDREAFFIFLQERWSFFLDRQVVKEDTAVIETKKPFGLSISGPIDLTFDHHDIRIYIDNMFVEGLLRPVSHAQTEILSKSWVGIGIQTDPAADYMRRLIKLIETLQSSIPAENAKHGEWFPFARNWAEVTFLVYGSGHTIDVAIKQKLMSLQSQIDVSFAAWLTKRYAGLINLPPHPPVMLHHIPRFLARYLEENRNRKIALLLIDGLSFDQWIVIRETLASQQPNYHFRENSVFAWIPTITSVSRQAAFAGKPPVFFPDSIQTTHKEQTLWSKFWIDQGLLQNEIIYMKGLGDGNLDDVEEEISRPQIRVAGLVIDKIDKIMHGMELGTAGMHNQVRQWTSQSFMSSLIEVLLDRGFRIYLTSDHGNIEAEGCGRPSEGAVADLRGERVRIYSDTILRDNVHIKFPHAIKWEPIGIPDNFLPLIAQNRKAFVSEGKRIVSHGGNAIEEVIVPLVQIKKGDA